MKQSEVKLSDIDPSLAALPRFARVTNGSTRQVDEMRRQHLYADGALSAKTKILMALLWSVSSRCEPCIKYYAVRAKEAGVSDAELGETLAVATTMGACVAETWAVKAFDAAAGEANGADCGC
jgi:AhpD family alkylhydroperoxidase